MWIFKIAYLLQISLSLSFDKDLQYEWMIWWYEMLHYGDIASRTTISDICIDS